MHFNKWLLGAACTLLVIAVAAVTWLHAAATPTIGALSANPAYIVINTSTSVIFTVQITDPTLIPNSVNLLKVDSNGKILTTIGVMHDDGINGDAKIVDKTFSYRVSVSEPAVGRLYYRTSAAFKGVLQRSLSSVIPITVDPFALPPDPGEAGKQTIAGVDSDSDGLRDDVERYIGVTYYASPQLGRAANQYAKAIQAMLIAPADATTANNDIRRIHRSLDCLYSIGGFPTQKALSDDLQKRMLDTPTRMDTFNSKASLVTGTFDLTPRNLRAAQCE